MNKTLRHIICALAIIFASTWNSNIYAQESTEQNVTDVAEEPSINISDSDAIELVKLIQTKKDYNDAVEFIESAGNFKELKQNDQLKEILVTKSNDIPDIKNPIWAESLWGIVLMALSFGFAALLTPCVFPLIPMTVTFFMKDGKGAGIRNALIYGVSIVGIYTLIGVGVSAIFGADTANQLATSAVSNLIFFAIFMVFAASFLGMFEITLPSWLVNRIDRQADKGGFMGPFFMAFTLVLVSFSCTGPIVGSVLVEAADGQFIKPIVAMVAFGTAIALPFTLFAIFPEWLGNLPKSGGWLNSVKVVLGFIEIALGLKFLSVADQVYGWGILDREIYLSIWIVIFALIGFYLLGKFKLPHDSDMDRVGVPRLMLAIVSFTFTVWMIPGLWGAQLKELAGYLPPMSTQSDYHVTEYIVRDIMLEVTDDQVAGPGTKANTICNSNPKYGDKLHLPHGLKGYYDLNEAIECAKKQNKPIFVDFTGHGCVNCRQMEQSVWKDPKVLRRLRNDFVVVALYCDDKKVKLSEDQYVTSKIDPEEQLTTLGEINSEYQQLKYGSNSQPLYVLLGTDGKKLPGVPKRNYNLDIDEFVKFLEDGKAAYNKKYNKKEEH